MIRKSIDFSVYLLIIIIALFAGGTIFLFLTINSDPIEGDLADDRVITSLFIIENDNKPLGTYLILLYPPNKQFAVFEITGDIGLIINEVNRVDRIDSVYRKGRITPFVGEIEKLLALTIRYTIVFDLDDLCSGTDLLEGVTVFVPGKTEYFSSTQSVIFPYGLVKMDGSKLKRYLTFENEDYETEKLNLRNQRFFTAFIKRIAEQKNYLNNSVINDKFDAFVKGNMNHRTKKRFFSELSIIDTDRIAITGVGGNYRNVSGNNLLIPYNNGSLIKEIVNHTLASLTRKTSAGEGYRIFTVEVLNGTGTSGLASRTAELIGGFGYDVMGIGNADRTDYEKTEIIDRTGTKENAEKFGEIIRCKNITDESPQKEEGENTALLSLSDYELKADFTLIVGRDFNGRYCQ
ncbi:MAG: LCP family protein [Termitinemataceae bacterium]|nr:MAG: LCP family protein [Termitinemataceae bacterium]